MSSKWLPVPESNQGNRPRPHIELISEYIAIPKYNDKVYLLREYVENQKSAAQIARGIGCARSTIIESLLGFDIPVRDDGLPQHPRGQVAFGEKVIKGQRIQHKGEYAIIEKLQELKAQGASYGDLVKWLHKNSIPTKNRSKMWSRTAVYKILKRCA